MTNHSSHPDLMMAVVTGVCWHSPTSDRWPCDQDAGRPAEIECMPDDHRDDCPCITDREH